MPQGEPPLVERDGELASLVAAIAFPPAVVVVDGESGIGKTCLVRCAIAEEALADRQQLIGSAHPALAACPLGPVIDALATISRPPVQRLSALCGVLRAVLPDLADILPPAPPPIADPQLARHRLVRASAELLSKLGPAILVLEDLQWADEATVLLLRMISSRPPPELSVVITCTSSNALPITGPAVVRVNLRALPVSGASRLALAILGDSDSIMPGELADLLYLRNGGVPIVVREDVLLLRQRGLLLLSGAAWTLRPDAEMAGLSTTVPPAVAAEIIGRAESLGIAANATLEAAAVLAESAESGLVARITGMHPEQTSRYLGDAARCGLLRDQGPDGTTVRFCHELARLAIYHAIPGHRRRRLHAAVARELVNSGRTVMILRAVEHHKHAGDLQGWAANAEAAADIAAANGSFETAHAFLRDILRAGAVADERRAEVAIKLGWTALGGVDRTKATATLLSAAQNGGTVSSAQQAELHLLRAWSIVESAETREETQAAVGEMYAAIGYLSQRPDLRAIVLAILAMPTRLPVLDLPAQMSHMNRAFATLAKTADPMAHTVVLTTAAHLLLAVGNPVGWYVAEAVPTHTDRPDVSRENIRGLLNLADDALHLGHYSRSRDLVERARRLACDVSLDMYDPQLRIAELRIRWTTGDLGAEDQTSALADHPDVRARLLWAQICAEQGRLDIARRTLLTVAEDAYRTGEIAVAAHAVAEFSRTAQAMAQRHHAHSFARRLLEELDGRQVCAWAAPLLAFIPVDLVRTVLPRYRSGLAGRDAPLARAALTFAEARVSEQDGDLVRAAAGYRRARHAYAALPAPRQMAHACVSEVRSRISSGQAADADLLRLAWNTFTQLGAVWDANRLKQMMRAAGVPVPHRRGRPGYGDRLSPREREITGLAASGHTNGEIAANLYLSERTVKYHLANAMRKLKVNSRRQLPDVLEPDRVTTMRLELNLSQPDGFLRYGIRRI